MSSFICYFPRSLVFSCHILLLLNVLLQASSLKLPLLKQRLYLSSAPSSCLERGSSVRVLISFTFTYIITHRHTHLMYFQETVRIHTFSNRKAAIMEVPQPYLYCRICQTVSFLWWRQCLVRSQPFVWTYNSL